MNRRIEEAIDLLQAGIDVGDKPEIEIMLMQQAIDILSEGKKYEPEPGEFTKEVRDRLSKILPFPWSYIKLPNKHGIGHRKGGSVVEFSHPQSMMAEHQINEKFIADSPQYLLEACDIIDRLQAELKAKDDILKKIKNWCDEYPLEVFPKLTKDNYQHAGEVLKANGLSLDRIKADNMRHVLDRIRYIMSSSL